MQVQRVNNTQPNFQALKLQTVTKKVGKVVQTIDVYSINQKDKAILDRMSEIVKSQTFPEDKKLLGADSVREVFENGIKRAKNLKDYAFDRVMLAVENGKKIVGIMDVENHGDQRVRGLAVWNGDKSTRDSLVRAGVKDTAKMDEFALILPTENKSDSIKRYYRGLGFYTPKDEKDLMIEYDKINKINVINDKDVNVKDYSLKRNIDLANVLNLDA